MKRVYLSLTKKGSIEQTIKALEAYKDEIHLKTEEFVYRLAECGITTAQANTGEYRGMIVFRNETQKTEDGVVGKIIATDGQKLIREWYTKKNKEKAEHRFYEVSPLLLAEFGSGWLSDVIWNVAGVGQGTMPNSYGHAMDENGWYWYDEDGVKHHSIGETPSYPMLSALNKMQFEINRIGREVFHG